MAGSWLTVGKAARWGWLAVFAAVGLAVVHVGVEAAVEPGSIAVRIAMPGSAALLLLAAAVLLRFRARRARAADVVGRVAPKGEADDGAMADHEGMPTSEPLAVRSGRTTHLVAPDSIRWVTAEGKYARIWLAGQSHLSQYSIAELEQRLLEHGFCRIHRSTLVNLQSVRALRARGTRDGELVTENGTVLKVARRRRHELERLLGLRDVSMDPTAPTHAGPPPGASR